MKGITVPDIQARKVKNGADPITALTAYDFTMASLLDLAGIEIILVGDSLGCVYQGHHNTLSVTLDEIVYHSKCVTKACKQALVIADLPFMSYQVSPEQALTSCGRLLKEGGVSAVKLEGGLPMAETIRRLVDVDIPVMAHVGMTPQSFHRMGGHKIQAKEEGSHKNLKAGTRLRIIEDAKAVEKAGAFAVVLEGIPSDVAKEITKLLSIPTIGIGSGKFCDGQILVSTDMLGLNPEFTPKLAKKFRNLADEVQNATKEYILEIKNGKFPSQNNEYLPKDKKTRKSKLKVVPK